MSKSKTASQFFQFRFPSATHDFNNSVNFHGSDRPPPRPHRFIANRLIDHKNNCENAPVSLICSLIV